MSPPTESGRAAFAGGVAVGLARTAAMTAAQTIYSKASGSEGSTRRVCSM
jgi:hypothetical protein